MKNPPSPTMSYSYGNQDEEFVFAYKSRPFAVMLSSRMPTPITSYIDHMLVKELGIKMTDFQCKKISFCGVKLRLLGKVSFTVQCIQEGRISGNFHLTASVVENLSNHFDTHCIAGVKTKALLKGGKDNCTSSGSPSPSRSSATIPSDCSTPTRDLLQRIADGNISPEQSPARSSSSSPRRHPPGFPPNPRFGALTAGRDHAKPFPTNYAAIIEEKIDPYGVNIYVLSENFNDADLEPTLKDEIEALKDIYEEGVTVNDEENMVTFISYDGSLYRSGHGRNKCSKTECVDQAHMGTIPNNCGFHPQWYLPPGFMTCGSRCQGAFCPCYQTSQEGYFG